VSTAKTELDLLRLLHSTEHTFVERKTVADTKDLIKTVVAFANTLSNDQEGVLFVGTTDGGEIEAHSSSLDQMQKSLADKLKNIYPAVYYETKTVQESGRECLAVIVPGSPSRPHFAGLLFVRDGSKGPSLQPQRDTSRCSRLEPQKHMNSKNGKARKSQSGPLPVKVEWLT
jgi:predicted HTH transcriptional regulator